MASAIVLVAAACGGNGRGAPARPQLAESLSPLSFFVGQWDAAVVASDGSESTLVWCVEPALDSTWLRGAARVPVSGVEARDYWGRDDASAAFVRIDVDSLGSFGELRSRGWDGDAWTFEGELVAGRDRIRVRELITRAGSDSFRAEWQMHGEDGWVTTSTELLERRSVGAEVGCDELVSGAT